MNYECRSCPLIEQPYLQQVAAKQARAKELLGAWPQLTWTKPIVGDEAGFRNKAKLVAGGVRGDLSFGLVDWKTGTATDLADCPLYLDSLAAAIEPLRRYLNRTGVKPYDVARKSGELKHLLISSGGDQIMARVVLRSPRALGRLQTEMPQLLDELPKLVVLSANIQPEHSAIIEGSEEFVLSEQTLLYSPLGELPLYQVPGSFFQTNTRVAAALYRLARHWVSTEVGGTERRGLDLYCGVGGFALTLAQAGMQMTGVEISETAIVAARAGAEAAGLEGATEFICADVAQWISSGGEDVELVVVNPPRRGLDQELVAYLRESGPRWLLYSSCNLESAKRDLELMERYRVTRAGMLDMFPHTPHFETLILAKRD